MVVGGLCNADDACIGFGFKFFRSKSAHRAHSLTSLRFAFCLLPFGVGLVRFANDMVTMVATSTTTAAEVATKGAVFGAHAFD